MKWSEQEKWALSVLWDVENIGIKYFSPVFVYGTGVICLCVGLSVFWKIMNNFWMDGPIWMKFSGLSRLVTANLGVGSTSAQSPPCREFSLESIYSVVVGATGLCHTILESMISQTIMWERIIDFGSIPTLGVSQARTTRGGRNFFQDLPIFFKNRRPEIKFQELFMMCNFFVGPLAEAIWPWPGLQ